MAQFPRYIFSPLKGGERATCILILPTAFVGQAIHAEASLSHLGLGVQEPVPAWGLMLQGGAEEYASTAPWIAIFPGLATAPDRLRLSERVRPALPPVQYTQHLHEVSPDPVRH